MKNQRGFIQIPLLVAIIAGVLVFGGGYLAVKQYQNYQAEKIEKEKIARETQQQKDSGVEKLKQEVEALKKQQAVQPSPKKVITPEVDEGSKIFSEWAKRTAKVTCSWKGYAHLESGKIVEGSGEYVDVAKTGSGTIFFKRNAKIPSVISNSHIVVYGNQCVIAVPSLDGGFYYYDSFAVIPSADLDVSIFFLPDESSTGMRFGPTPRETGSATI